MGYTTDFAGRFDLDRPLQPEHLAYINKFSETRRMRRDSLTAEQMADPVRAAASLPIGEEGCYFVGGIGFGGQGRDASVLDYNEPPVGQPGLWCQWVATDDGLHIEWNGAEKFYEYTMWLRYICDHFLTRWGYTLNGEVTWQGEDRSDKGRLQVVNNKVSAHRGHANNNTVEVTIRVPSTLLENYREAKDEGEDDVAANYAREIADLVLKAAL